MSKVTPDVRRRSDDMGDGDEVDLTDDIVGVTSARLLADGVPAEERRLALRLLSVLLAVADADRRVRRPLAQLAGEFELPAGDVEGWVDALEATGAVEREPGGLRLAAREREDDDAFQLHDFLAVVAELDQLEERPVPARRNVRLRPAGTVLAAAAVLVAALLAPGIVRDTSTPTTPASASRGEEQRTPPAAVVAEEPEVAATTTTAAAELPAAVDSPAVAAEDTPAPVPTTPTTLLPCPVGIPTVDVIGATTAVAGGLAVTGIARNPSTHDIAIQRFTLRTTVAGEDITVPGTEVPLVVPAGSTVAWEVLLPVLAPPGTPVRATLGDWEWRGVPVTCPSP